MMATMPTTSAISEERSLSEVSSKLDEITYVFAPKLPGSLQPHRPLLPCQCPLLLIRESTAHGMGGRSALVERGEGTFASPEIHWLNKYTVLIINMGQNIHKLCFNDLRTSVVVK